MNIAGILLAAIQLASPFADHMVLQRDKKVPVWGSGTPGENVVVEFAGQRHETKVGGDGRWRVDLAPMPACCEGLMLKAGEAEVKDVLVGEVWLCAGQSNMGLPLCGGNPRYRDRQGSLVAQMTHRPMIRYVSTPVGWGFEEQTSTISKPVWRTVVPENTMTRSFSAVAFYFALDVESEIRVPVGLVGVYVGGTGIDSWTPPEGTRSRPDLKDISEWKPVPKDKWTKECARGAIDRVDQQPAVYWNKVVAPWAPFACRGMLWYQGEHDAGEPQRYCSKLHALYDGWKGRFENPEMRFYFVQLCPWGKNIAPIQEEMARFERECPNAAMAVINDIGNNSDIHPNEKALVGHRLALHALKRDYGFGEIRDNSPSVESWRVVSNTFVVVFKDCKSLYVYRNDWKFDLPFEIAGADGVFHPAEVLNLKTTKGYGGKPERKGDFEGERTLVIGSREVDSPVHLRYLYCAPWTGCIFNEVNLPLGAFHLKRNAKLSAPSSRDFVRLQGAVGDKADRLFENRLLSKKARGDIFDETVNAFRTCYDDRHPDRPDEKPRMGYWQGEYWGKTMLSHCAYACYSGDADEIAFIHAKARELVETFQRPNGYLSTYEDEDNVFGFNWNVWSRKYTTWALLEAYDLTGDKALLDAAARVIDHLAAQLKRLGVPLAKTGYFSGLPSMSILKPIVMLAERTGERRFMDFAREIVVDNDRADGRAPNLVANAFSDKPIHKWYPDPQKWAKSYEMMSVVEGLVAFSKATGEARPFEAAKRIFDKLAKDEMNGVCSVGFHDHFVGARAYPNAMSESCDVIHWMRLCRFLYETTGETRYLDFWERAFLNAFMAGVFRGGKWGTHDVRGHGKRHLHGMFEVSMLYHFCCIANDPRGFCDYADLALERLSDDSYNLNFYTDGEYCRGGVRFKVSGNYPVGQRVTVRVASPRAVTVGLRQPGDFSFSLKGASARETGARRIAVSVPAGETVLELAFDMPVKVERWRTDLPQEPSIAQYQQKYFEMAWHDKEMVGFARKEPGVRVLRGPLLLAKCMLVGDADKEVFGDIGVDETWKASLSPRSGADTWGCWSVVFEKGGVRKSVGASDYQSAADFDDWQNSFSIWF